MNTKQYNSDMVKKWAGKVMYWEHKVTEYASLLSTRLEDNSDTDMVDSASSLLDNAIDGMAHANKVLLEYIIAERTN